MKQLDEAWISLEEYAKEFKSAFRLREAFESNPQRFQNHSILLESNPNGATESLLYDYSKNMFDSRVLELLFRLAEQRNVLQHRAAMFNGELVNNTEQRAALHVALRGGMKERKTEVQEELQRMHKMSACIRTGKWLGCTGKPIRNVINVGIGGSDLGPQMVCQALDVPGDPSAPNVCFVSNVDEVHLNDTLVELNPEETLFVVVSKTFSTQETMHNAKLAKSWLTQRMPTIAESTIVARHFVAVSGDPKRVAQFGIQPENVLKMWDWVGGRYSVWSTVGFAVAVAIGFEKFEQFLQGASTMDQHFVDAPMHQNIPILMALLGIWYNNFLGAETLCVVPYEQRLARMPAYLQQLEMESNGKCVDKEGSPVGWTTCPIIWGEPGTNGQHAFFQLLHQGTKLIPVDFFVGALPAEQKPAVQSSESHSMLVANCLAQGEALMRGRTAKELDAAWQQNALRNHRLFPGNRPSSTFVYRRLSPFSLGMVLAAYEHKVFVQSCIWNINPFDQWGVELGKSLADNILKELSTDAGECQQHDASTDALLTTIKTWKLTE